MTLITHHSTAGVLDLIADVARIKPNHPAVVDETRSLDYESLVAEARRLTAHFCAQGITSGTRIGLWCPNSSFWLAANLAIAQLGAVSVAINARYPVSETARVARAADLSALIVDLDSIGVASSSTVEELLTQADVNIDTVFVREGKIDLSTNIQVVDCAGRPSDSSDSFQSMPPDPNAGFVVFTSSGSTGKPKLILHSQRGVTEHSRAIARSFAYTAPHTVVLGQLPLCGVWGFNTAYAALAAGATLVTMERYSADEAVRLVEKYRITHANGPDQFVRTLFAAADITKCDISSMKGIGFSTFSNDARELVDLGDDRGISLFQVYGSSEQQALMLHQPVQGTPSQRADAGGRPSNPLTQVRIRDVSSGELVSSDEPGMIESTGPNSMLGYFIDGDIDRSCFSSDGWIITGDIGQIAEHGIRYLTRDKDALRLSGFLVDPKEIELTIEQHVDVAEAKVVGVDIRGRHHCVAFTRLNTGKNFDAETIRRHCQQELATFKVPAKIHQIDAFPQIDGANGPRIQRLALRDLALSYEGANS